ncbi:hypothetical protein HMN09_01250300 [Mycena chlorophos]|uniref:Cystathionine gamma-synthase n=1 Tax=Mycena chlorophos TaxID=658473 RepID=A0A8H6S364_MYCCL|nr:hypothetical protein HMN09_01250300 [Mycena chlorophos]
MALSSQLPLGLTVPPHTAHAISVSLPTWRDVIGYEEAEKRVTDAMISVGTLFNQSEQLAKICEQKFGTKNESCMLFPTHKVADQCRSFIQSRTEASVSLRLIHFSICPEDRHPCDDTNASISSAPANLHIVLFPEDIFPIAKQFWQHTGMGISSRLAEHCLALLPASPTSPTFASNFSVRKGYHKHYSSASRKPSPPATPDSLELDHSVYVEERYGRNLPLSLAASAKRALRRRISGVLVRDAAGDGVDEPSAGDANAVLGPSSRGVSELSENDVFLYPTGMAAIWSAHQLVLGALPPQKSVCLGFPYTDTLKVLQKWGPGCHFIGDADIDELERLLEEESARDPTRPPILALFTEFPSNPLLRSTDLARLRNLADKYSFLIVIDETVGNFLNVEVFPYADIVVSSLTKVFSGYSNVMGGGLCLNPQSKQYNALKAHIDATFQDVYFDEDAIYMERNSRDFHRRVKVINDNALAVCDFLQAKTAEQPQVVKQVFYPKYMTPENYEKYRIKGEDREGGGYGGLFSVTFTSMPAARAFFDALPFYKGPSLGTSFTLACPYAVLVHYTEMDWAAKFGVEETMVRVSVGQEETDGLVAGFKIAVEAAERASTA